MEKQNQRITFCRMSLRNAKQICCVLVAVAMISGCSTSRKTVSVSQARTEDHTQADLSRLSKGATVQTGRSVWDMIEEMHDREDIRIVFYDTSKPTEPETGRPPVQAEATVQADTWRKQEFFGQDTVSRTESVQEEQTDRTRYDVETESDIEERGEYRSRPTWIHAVGWVVALLIWLMILRIKK